MKKLKEIAGLIIAFPVFIYLLFTRKAYYITGTFMKNGTRMFFKVVFETRGDILPIKSIEQGAAKQFGVDNVIVLHFNRISKRMMKYVDEPYDLQKIEITDKYK